MNTTQRYIVEQVTTYYYCVTEVATERMMGEMMPKGEAEALCAQLNAR